MNDIFATLMFTAPDWVRAVITHERQPNIFWSEYVVWPLIQILVVLLIVLTVAAYLVWGERKMSALLQAQLGNLGILQPAADGLQSLVKADTIPPEADESVFTAAPIISVVVALVVLAVVPWGSAWATIANINIGVLFVLAVSSLSVFGLVLAGWSLNARDALLSVLRSASQLVSYEIGMGLSIIGALMFAHTLSLNTFVEAQQTDRMWYVLFQPAGFLVYIISALGIHSRQPETGSGIEAGHHTAYTGFRRALFFAAEYTSVIVMAAIAVTLFLGGWSLFDLESRIAPLAVVVILAVALILLALLIIWRNVKSAPPSRARTMGIVVAAIFALTGIVIAATQPFNEQSARVWFSVLVFIIKIFALIYGYMRARWTWPRYRYDHLMQVGWKWLIPAGLINIVMTAIWYLLALPKQQGGLFNDFLIQRGERLTPTGKGMAYFIATAFVLTLPIVWGLLVTINGRPRGLNLAGQQQK